MRAVGAELQSPEILRTPGELLGVLDEWRVLAAREDQSSFFSSPDWSIAWWEHVAPSTEGEVALWRADDGRLIGVAGLVHATDRLHPRFAVRTDAWVNLGSGIGGADHCSWPVLPEAIPQVRSWLARKAASRTILLRNIDGQLSAPFVPAGARKIDLSICPRVDILEDGQELSSASPRFRKHLRQYARRLGERGVAFRWVAPGDVDSHHLDLLYDLHAKRQVMKGASSSFGSHLRGLHERLIGLSGPTHGPALVVAECDGAVVGMLYGFVWRDTFAYFQTGWDPIWSGESLGTVLVREALRFAGQAGARVFDFLRGPDEYKYRFGAVDRVDESWLVPKGLSGSALRLKYGAKAWRSRRQSPVVGA